jgi:hypothetical protein
VLIPDRMLGKKWKPNYFSGLGQTEALKIDIHIENKADEAKKKMKKRQELSTKGEHSTVKVIYNAVPYASTPSSR